MKIHLVGSWPFREKGIYDCFIYELNPYVLESFVAVNADTERLIPYYGGFLLDSGAFTFMSGNGGVVDWDSYIMRYADFIIRNNVTKFFELDIDSIVGYERVKKLRAQLETLTGRKCIPVWHVSRGKDEFIRMCDEYDYVAIGGIVSKEITPDKYGGLPLLIKEAHKRGAKIHGLGFTSLKWLPRCHFDSVDSTSWLAANRFGIVYFFDGKTMKQKRVPKGQRIGDIRGVAVHNFLEWLKFSKYAETHFNSVRTPH